MVSTSVMRSSSTATPTVGSINVASMPCSSISASRADFTIVADPHVQAPVGERRVQVAGERVVRLVVVPVGVERRVPQLRLRNLGERHVRTVDPYTHLR